MPDISVQESDRDSNALVLTISKTSFGEFIRDLISEKQRIRRDVKGSFVLTRDEILDLIALVTQRVTFQNQVVLATIAIRTRYRDGYQQEFQSLEAFNALRDARQSEVCAVYCNMTYVIKFPGREKPEKQELNIVVHNVRAFEEVVTDKESFSIMNTLALGAQETGGANIELEYTEISWGYDLENLIFQYLMRKFSKTTQAYTWLRIYSIPIVGFATLSVLLGYIGKAWSDYIDQNTSAAAILVDRDATLTLIEKIHKKIDLLLGAKSIALTSEQVLSISAHATCIAILGVTIVLMLAIRRQSFLILNDYTKRLHIKYLKRRDYIRYALITSFIVGLCGSLGASF